MKRPDVTPARPAHVARIFRTLKREFFARHAPIREFKRARTEDPFRILAATILSARTKDETTAAAADRLFARAASPGDLRALSAAEIERLIFPVGFYRTKARHLKALPDALDGAFGGRVPDTLEGLCALPGVGRKTANLVLGAAFGKPAICVDVHVHRISNRLGLVRTRSPAQTEAALEAVLPKRCWIEWNEYLVSFGQTVCLPARPKCGVCPIARLCPRVGVPDR